MTCRFLLTLAALAVPLAVSAAPAETAERSLNEALHTILAGAGIQPRLREELQRPVDPRLLLIESKGWQNCGLFSGKRYEARNAAEAQSLAQNLRPGDQLILVGGNWKDASLFLSGEGTAEAPIFIGAETAGAAVFTGSATVSFSGRHLVIMNLVFRDGVVTGKSREILRVGYGKEHPADHCLVNRVTIENVNSPDPADLSKVLVNYLSFAGHDNTVAHSTFAHLKNYGVIIATGTAPSPEPLRLHILNNRFIDRPRIDHEPTPPRFKIIQIGWSGLKAAPAGSLVQDNLFKDCASFVELVSIKVSDVFLRRNRFIRCEGGVNIRMGDRVLIQDNLFDGENRPGTGGLRVAGQDHVIIGNVFRRLNPTKDNYMIPPPQAPTAYLTWPLAIVMGDHEFSGFRGDTYGRADRVLVSHNRFEGSAGRIALGISTPSVDVVPLPPQNIWIEHNTFSGDGKGDQLFDYTAPKKPGTLLSEVFTYDNRFLP